MIVAELYRYYERLSDDGELPAYGYSTEKVTATVLLDRDGRVLDLLDERSDEAVGRKGRTVKRPALLDVPQPPTGRTSGIKAGFLYDNAAYLFGREGEGKRAGRAAAQFAASRRRHETVLEGVDHPSARTVLRFFAGWTPGAVPETPDAELLDGFLVFRVDGDPEPVHAIPEIRAAWERAVAAEEAGAEAGQCLATGLPGQPIAGPHPMIKGVPGAQSSGAAIVSANAAAFESYGRSGLANAPVSVRVSRGYTAALNHLLAQRDRRHVVVGDVSVVFWTDRPTPAEADMARAFSPPERAEDEDTARELKDAFIRLAGGRDAYPPEDRGVGFHVLGLSGNAGRIAVRFWVNDSLGAMADRLARHFRDLELAPAPWDARAGRPSVWVLANETKIQYRRDGDHVRPDPGDKGLGKLLGDLMRAVLTGGDYPASLLAVLLDRIRADHVVNHRRVAMIKAVLVRRRRGTTGIDEGERLVALDENRTDPGYLLGRLFAVLESIQRAAAEGREVNATIRDKYVGAASATPRAVFPHLLDLAHKHLKKVRRERGGLAHMFDARLAAIQAHLSTFPPTLDLEQRGLFFLGYYHERADRKAPKAAEADGAAPTETISADPE